MMTISENANPYGQGRAKTCKVCGKEGSTTDIKKNTLKQIILLGSLFHVAHVEKLANQELH